MQEERDLSDSDYLVAQCRSGNREAIESFYRVFQPRLHRNLGRVVRDPFLREDVVQETLIKALSRLDCFDCSRPLWPWLRTIGLRTAFDHLSKRRRESARLVFEPAVAHQTVLEDWEGDPVLFQTLAAISERHRVALSLRYLEDRPGSEVAVALGLSKGAFDQLIFRARARFAAEYRRALLQ